MLEKYRNHAPSIFKDETFWGTLNLKGLLKCLYSNDGLHSLLNSAFGNKLMSSLQRDCIFPTFNLDQKRVFIFGSKRNSNYCEFGIENSDEIPIKDAVLVSCSAPFYFPIHEFSIKGKLFRFVDGGIFANNPTMETILELHSRNDYLLKLANNEIFFLSLGTGIFNTKYTVNKQSGFKGWILKENLPKVFLDASSTSIDRYFETYLESVGMPPENYLRINPKLPSKFKEFDFKDDLLIEELIKEARASITDNTEPLERFMNFINN